MHIWFLYQQYIFLNYIYTAVWIENSIGEIFLKVQKACVEITSKEAKQNSFLILTLLLCLKHAYTKILKGSRTSINQTLSTYQLMSLLKPNNYLSIAPQVKVSVALEIWDPNSNEFPRDDAVGPGLHFQKPGCRLLLMCPCSLILKEHHQAYWEMFHLFKVIRFLFIYFFF